MPELPEVETIRRGLEKVLLGQKLVTSAPDLASSGRSRGAKLSLLPKGNSPHMLPKDAMVSRGKVTGLRRFGKLLVIDFSNGESLAFHLRMTGQLVYRSNSGERLAGGHPNKSFIEGLPDKTTRAIFEFEDGTLFFNDQRKFGFYEFLPTSEVEKMPFVAKLGPEPWDITFANFKKRLMRHKRSKIKAVLLDQTVMAGLGNIYADETLYFAHVHPERLVESLTDSEIKKIISGAKHSMEESLKSGGSSLKNYLRVDGTYGDYLTLFAKVYGRKGEPCECGGVVEKIKVAGRGTHFCPKCQKAPKA